MLQSDPGEGEESAKGLPFWIAGVGFLAVLLLGSAMVYAQEALEDMPTPSSVDEVITPLERSYQKEPPREEAAKSIHPFLRDQRLDLNLRTYFMSKDKTDNSMSEAWAIGGALRYKSGYLYDLFGVGAAVYTSQPL